MAEVRSQWTNQTDLVDLGCCRTCLTHFHLMCCRLRPCTRCWPCSPSRPRCFCLLSPVFVHIMRPFSSKLKHLGHKQIKPNALDPSGVHCMRVCTVCVCALYACVHCMRVCTVCMCVDCAVVPEPSEEREDITPLLGQKCWATMVEHLDTLRQRVWREPPEGPRGRWGQRFKKNLHTHFVSR